MLKGIEGLDQVIIVEKVIMKVLFVEDEHRIASSIKKGLEMKRFVVDVAYDGIEGFDLASTGDYDCIVLDLMLYGIDGLEIYLHLREEGIHTPVLVLTTKGELDDKIKGFETGADDYLILTKHYKPRFSPWSIICGVPLIG